LAAPPTVSQCYYWAVARRDEISDKASFAKTAKLLDATNEKLQELAESNKPDFAAVNRKMKNAADEGIQSEFDRLPIEGHLEPPLFSFIRQGNVAQVTQLICSDAALAQLKIGSEWTALHYAAHFDRVEIINLLPLKATDLDRPAGPNADTTPLCVASRQGNTDCVRALIRLGAAVNPPFTAMYRIPLREVITFSDDSDHFLLTAEALLQAGASCRHGGHGTAPIHNAAHLPRTVRILLEHVPSSIQYRDLAKMTVLHHAVRRRCKESVKLLLEPGHGVEVNAEDECGFTPLHWACRALTKQKLSYHPSELEQLIDTLAVGTLEDVQDIACMLRAAGADIDATLFDGEYGPHLTPDSFLYDRETDVSDIKIRFAKFNLVSDANNEAYSTSACSDIFTQLHLPPNEVDASDSAFSLFSAEDDSRITIMRPSQGPVRYEYIVEDVLPNDYEFIACIGCISSKQYTLPDAYSFEIFSEVCLKHT
jgi:ankyrin repeat protein